MIEAGNEEQGLARLEEALKANPNDTEMRNYYLRHARSRCSATCRPATTRAPRASSTARSRLPARAALRPGQRQRAGRPRRPWRATAPRSALVRRGASEALKRGDTEAALAKAKEVLDDNPAQRDARAIVRKVEEQKVKAERTSPQLGAALKNTITIELRDAPVRTVFELISKRTGLNFIFDRDVPRRPARHGVRARHHDRGSDPLRAGHQPARAQRAERQHGADLPEHAGQGAGLPGAGGEELLPRQRRREADRATWCASWSRRATCSSTRS